MPAGCSSRTRRFAPALLTALLLLAALAAGGCATRSSDGWAQTAPVIAQSQPGEEILRLGAVSDPVALHDSAEDPVRN